MSIITNRTHQVKLYGAALALAALIMAVLALSLFTGGAQAQNADGTYDDPQPCGPGAGTAFQHEPHEITSGHYILFDAYWETTGPSTGVLHTNHCPPQVTTTEEDGETVTTLTPSGLDIDEAIIHILDKHKATVIENANDAANYPDATVHLRLDQYPDLADYVNAGEEVWWLRLDDPYTTEANEQSDLTLGFSTMRLDEQYWAADGDGPAFRYHLEFERNPGIDPAEHPHFIAYKQRKADLDNTEARAELVWDTGAVNTTKQWMSPGQLQDLQWIFTKTGTYELSVHLKGIVHQPPDDADWDPISDNDTETSDVKRYVIQVGTPLAETEPPKFGVIRSVLENSPAGTEVGGPVRVFGAEVDRLTYSLSPESESSDKFALVPVSDPDAVQIVVADGAELDRETKSTYDLILGVTDGVDHEHNPDFSLDHTLAVRVELEDEAPSVTLSATPADLYVDEIATVTATMREAPPGSDPILTWYESDDGASWTQVMIDDIYEYHDSNLLVDNGFVGSVKVKAKMDWGTGSAWSNVITLHWQASTPPPSSS